MPDDARTPVDLNQIVKNAERDIAAGLQKAPYLVLPHAAKAVAKDGAAYVVPFPNGSLRVLKPGTGGSFYEVTDTADPLAPLIADLAQGVSDEDRVEAVKLRAELVEQLTEEKRLDSRNWL